MEENRKGQEIIINIRRYNPETMDKPCWQDFKLFVKPGMTVLEGLIEIKEKLDSSLAMRFSCRMGVCGSCAMLINGKPSLACNTQILHVAKKVLAIGPLPNFNIIKDLVPDLTPLFKKHQEIKPYIKRSNPQKSIHPTEEFYQSPQELIDYMQFAYCIKCGACMAACPTFATDTQYPGPVPLTQAHRYNTDSRDEGFKDRKKKIGTTHGVFRCHYGSECSNVCPKGVDPARAIQHMKRNLVLDYFKLLKSKKSCKTLGKIEGAKRIDKIPDPPKFTV